MTAPVWTFRPDGSVMDLLALTPADIDFGEMANALSKISRFNGRTPGLGYSVAQHCVMGADALFAETRDHAAAAAFLLHDGHEYLLGDIVTPVTVALDALMPRPQNLEGMPNASAWPSEIIATLKSRVDQVIVGAAKGAADLLFGQPNQIKEMDRRLFDAEILALFGPKAAPHRLAPHLPPPKLTGAIRPWGAAKAEAAFCDRLGRYAGMIVRPMAGAA